MVSSKIEYDSNEKYLEAWNCAHFYQVNIMSYHDYKKTLPLKDAQFCYHMITLLPYILKSYIWSFDKSARVTFLH